MLERLDPQSPDALLALIKLHASDTREDKIDLGVGVYRDADGDTPVFRSIKGAEAQLLEQQDSKAYLGPEGDMGFVHALMPYIFGRQNTAKGGRIEGMQTPGGTGAVRLALALVQRAGVKRVLLGTPSWPNHAQILEDLGLEVVTFPHVLAGGQANVNGLLEAIHQAGPYSAVLLHGCCHNPTGIDYTDEDWTKIAHSLVETGVFPIIDLAYQGLGRGLEEDAQGLRRVLAEVPEALIAYSCDKNFGLYRDRVGALYMMAAEPGQLDRITSNANALARATWSMPPDHGAAAVRLTLRDTDLTQQWLEELQSMRERMRRVRQHLAGADEVEGLNLRALAKGNGLFAMLDLDEEQIAALRKDHGVYMAGSGRINVAGLTEANTPKFIAALKDVTA